MGEAIGTNSIVPVALDSPGLTFGRSHILPERIAVVLTQHGRFQEVNLEMLTERGATHFAWIRPGEFCDDIANPNGSFAYKFGGRGPRYYPVVDTPTFTRCMLEEELDDTEAWVVLRIRRPPALDRLVILDKACCL